MPIQKKRLFPPEFFSHSSQKKKDAENEETGFAKIWRLNDARNERKIESGIRRMSNETKWKLRIPNHGMTETS